MKTIRNNIVLSSTALAICESSLWFIWAKVGQRQLTANSQAKQQTWPLSPPVGCYRPDIHPSPFALLLYQPTEEQRTEGWVELRTTERVCNPCPNLCIAVVFVKNTETVRSVGLILGLLVPQSSAVTSTSKQWFYWTGRDNSSVDSIVL